MTTDASPSGWGAHCEELQIHGLWSKRESTLHINQLELLAIMKAFQAFLPRIKGKTVQLVTDNTTVMHYINSIITSPSSHHRLLGMVFHPPYLPSGNPYLIRGQLPGRPSKQAPHEDAQMVPQRHRLPGHMPQMGSAYSRPLRLPSQCEVPQILLKSRHRHLFSWRCLHDTFTESEGLTPVPSSLSMILTFILYLFNFGLVHSTIKVYIAAIVAHQPPRSSSAKLFPHPTLKRFLKGLQNIHPPSQKIVPQWSLQLVLQALTKPPFEPMATCNENLFSLKTAFLVPTTSARKASELSALRSDSPYLQMHPDKVTLYLDMSFLPRVVSEFHVNQLILPTFFPSPFTPIERKLHSLDVKRATAFYLHRTNSFRHSSCLFLCYHGTNRGAPVSPQMISRWIV